MWMIPKGETVTVGLLRSKLQDTLLDSRFTADLTEELYRGKWGVKIMRVRLRYKKDYCGAHPGPCLNNFRKHMKASLLEGMDWVAFNAMLNNMLDKLKADCDVFSFNQEATVYGGKYFIRIGTRRRVLYPFAYRDRFAFARPTSPTSAARNRRPSIRPRNTPARPAVPNTRSRARLSGVGTVATSKTLTASPRTTHLCGTVPSRLRLSEYPDEDEVRSE